MAEPKQLTIRPFARLLTMLGEQLIKNERIALIELIKNAYDADAAWVKVSFINFEDDYKATDNSKIIIEDSGCGMTAEIIEKHWLNPATPEKKLRKQKKQTTESGRIIQGDKGIGRFAILKLGRVINIVTRAKGAKVEHEIKYDFSMYDDEFLTKHGKSKELFIDDLSVFLEERKPQVITNSQVSLATRKFKREQHGTYIEISDLKGSWSSEKIDHVYRDIARLESIFLETTALSRKTNNKNQKEFTVVIYKDDKHENYQERYLDELKSLLDYRSVISIKDGFFDDKKQEFRFTIREPGINKPTPQAIKLRDSKLSGSKVFRDRFTYKDKKSKKVKCVLDERKIECGPFHFGFFIFDFSADSPLKYKLDPTDKDIIRQHRIYLYRDKVRVYPYGEPDDDWLRIDAYRGTVAAGHFLSNDQVVGYANISQKSNSKLKDKTNREGLIEEGNATEDFVTLLKILLAYIRQKPYARYRLGLKNKKAHDIFRTEQVQKEFDRLKDAVKDNKKAHNLVSNAEKEYKAERRYLVQRAETTEDLAGVGLSVETASHDIMAIMDQAMTNIDSLIKEAMHKDLDQKELQKELQSLRGMMSFIESQLKDVQLLFKSSKQRRKRIKITEVIEKVEFIYRRFLKKENIDFSIKKIGSPLIAKTTDAVLLQLLLNLIDNAVYWHQQTSARNKKIEVLLDGNKGQMIFSDNGPGVDKEDAPYIFEPMYSGKGEDGRGLGLYIARQLLERNDYTIELADIKSEKILPGANFIVNFITESN